MHTVKSLREEGFSVRVHHIRKYINDPNDDSQEYDTDWNQQGYKHKQILLARGGSTDVAVTTPTGENVRAIAYCSDKDGYNKKRGVMIALGRALKQLNNPVEKQFATLDNYEFGADSVDYDPEPF